jgi:DNA-binding winged helix-turn-helix (wHTH) protein/tetratricopeptide (TPR) repeat protein
MPPRIQGTYSFAVFSFNSRTGDLARNGHCLRITEQARQVLSTLLENAGNIVTREELRQQLWPGGEFLDWDHSINKVVAQLRATLRDNARETRFIETVPKRGYRFIAPVTFEPEIPKAESTAAAPEQEASAVTSSTEAPPPEVASEPATIVELSATAVIPQIQQAHRAFLRRIAIVASLTVFLGVLAALMMTQFSKREPSSLSVGIPPFEASGEGSDTVAESFRMDLTSAVAELPKVQVRAAHSLTTPLRNDETIRSTSKSLQLDVLLFGKITFSGDQCVLNLEVVRGRDAVHLASFRYSGSRQELGTIREKIQRDLFDQLGLAERGGSWRVQAATPDAHAYKDYLQARLDLSGWADAPVQKALQEFQKAIDEDPNFANAYAGLASAYVVLAEHDAAPREASYRKAQEAAAKAVQLAPSTAEAHAILGQVALRKDWNFEVAEREMRRAIELDPSRAIYHLWLSVLLCFQSRFDESLQQIDLARAADPLWPPVYRTEAFLAERAGQIARAVQASEKHAALMPNWPASYDQRAWGYWFAGRYEDAIADWGRMAQMENDTARMQLEEQGLQAFRQGGPAAYARVRLRAIESGHEYHHAAMDFVPAEWYSIQGNYDKALAEVEKMVTRHDPDALSLAVNPTLAPLHNQPRFVAALIRIGLNQPRLRPTTADALPSTIRSSAALNPPAR